MSDGADVQQGGRDALLAPRARPYMHVHAPPVTPPPPPLAAYDKLLPFWKHWEDIGGSVQRSCSR